MKFAYISTELPGLELNEKYENARACGCSGVEELLFPEDSLKESIRKIEDAAGKAEILISDIIAGGLDLSDSRQLPWIKDVLDAAAHLDSSLLMTAEFKSQSPPPVLPPFVEPSPKEKKLVEKHVNEIAERAEALGVAVHLEPVTQFYSKYWRDVDTVLRLCKKTKSPALGIAVDFHNMNIAEANIEESVCQAGTLISHVHLADNNRLLPGKGHIPFGPALSIIEKNGFEGWYSFECTVFGEDFVSQVATAIDRVIRLASEKETNLLCGELKNA